MKKIFINIIAYIIYKTVRLIGRLPDKTIIFLINTFNPLLKLFDKEKTPGGPLGEMKEIFTDFPGGSEMVKNIIRESRPSQLISTMRGILRHHVFSESRLKIDNDPLRKKITSKQKNRQSKQKENLKIAILGNTYDLQKLADAYEKSPGRHQTTDITETTAETELNQFDILEVARLDNHTGELIMRAIEKGIMISIHHNCLSAPGTLKAIWQKAANMRAPLRIVYPQLYYPPVQALKNLLNRKELGEIATIRVQAIIGGEGGPLTPEKPATENYLSHPAFNHFILFAFLGGPLLKATSYRQPIDLDVGGQSIVGIKFVDEGRYGMLECVYAPEMFIKSANYPYALQLEVAGTDGLAWVRAGMGELSQSPPLLVRVGKRSFPAGVETGMDYSWDIVYENMATHAQSMLRGKKTKLIDIPEIISLLDTTETESKGRFS